MKHRYKHLIKKSMSDAKKNETKSTYNDESDSIESMVQENFSFESRVNKFFETSKEKYLSLKKSGKLQQYTIIALIMSFSLGVLSQTSTEMMASLFAFMQK